MRTAALRSQIVIAVAAQAALVLAPVPQLSGDLDSVLRRRLDIRHTGFESREPRRPRDAYLASTLALLLAAAIAAFVGTRARIGELFEFAIYRWSVFYLFVAMRRVYRAGAFKTVLGLGALAISYMVFYALGVSIAGMYAFLRA